MKNTTFRTSLYDTVFAEIIPSISTRSWLSVFSCSLCPPKCLPLRFRPTASISSINKMHGECFLAIWNMSLTWQYHNHSNGYHNYHYLLLRCQLSSTGTNALNNRLISSSTSASRLIGSIEEY